MPLTVKTSLRSAGGDDADLVADATPRSLASSVPMTASVPATRKCPALMRGRSG